MNYEVSIWNVVENGIVLTTDPVDNVHVFATFREAKAEYLKGLRANRDAWNESIKRAKSLKREDL